MLDTRKMVASVCIIILIHRREHIEWRINKYSEEHTQTTIPANKNMIVHRIGRINQLLYL